MRKYIIILSSILLVVIAAGTFGYFVLFGSGTYTTDNIENYYDFASHNENGIKSDLCIFPKTLPKTTSNSKYFYSFSDTFLDTTFQIYLDCKYSDDEFESEINRLKSIKYEDGNTIFDTKNFNFDAYVARVGYDCTSEYALINKANNRIVYIYLQFAKIGDIHFDSNLLPNGYQSYGECNDSFTAY